MYANHFGFRAEAFSLTPDPDFLYLSPEHSEALADQEQSCELTRALDAYPETHDVYRYALLHRDVIRRFGRFPHRNAVLGRASTADEIEFLKQPGSSF